MALEQADLDQIAGLIADKLATYSPPESTQVKELKATVTKLQTELLGVTELVTKPTKEPEEKPKGEVKDPTAERVKALETKLQESEAKAAKAQLETAIDSLMSGYKIRDDSKGLAKELLKTRMGGFKASEAGYLNDSGESLEDGIKAFFGAEGKALLKANREVSGVDSKGTPVGNPSTSTDSKDIAWSELVF
jgi:hypothetical protein